MAPVRIAAPLFAGVLLVTFLPGCGEHEPTAIAVPAPAASRGGVALPPPSRGFIAVEAVEKTAPGTGNSYFGRIAFRPRAVSTISAPFSGRITAVAVEPGGVVRAGSPLFTIESADVAALRAALEQARLKVQVADEALSRQTEMVKRGVGLELERVEAEFKAREARAELARSEKSAELAGAGSGTSVVVRAPVDGVVVGVKAAAGATVQAGGEPLVEIGDPAGLWAVAEVPERDATFVSPGEPAEVALPALDVTIAGRVAGVAPRTDPETRRTAVYVALSDPPRAVRAGLLAGVTLGRASGEAALWLPAAAVLLKDGRRVVYVEAGEGRYEPREVQTADERGGRVRVVRGLDPGTRVVTRGALLVDREAEQLL